MLDAIADVFVPVIAAVYAVTGSYGIAIILLTVAIKLILHPLTRKQLKSARAMQELAPHLAVLREKYKDDPKTLQAETMNLYRSHGVNPFGGCLPMLLQLPVLYGLFTVLRRPGIFQSQSFLGVPLARTPGSPGLGALVTHEPLLLLIPLMVGLTTYWQQHISVTDPQQAKMMVFMPVLIGYFALNFPFALSVYWIVSTLISVAEYYIVVGRARPAAVPSVTPKRELPAGVLPQRPKGAKKR